MKSFIIDFDRVNGFTRVNGVATSNVRQAVADGVITDNTPSVEPSTVKGIEPTSETTVETVNTDTAHVDSDTAIFGSPTITVNATVDSAAVDSNTPIIVSAAVEDVGNTPVFTRDEILVTQTKTGLRFYTGKGQFFNTTKVPCSKVNAFDAVKIGKARFVDAFSKPPCMATGITPRYIISVKDGVVRVVEYLRKLTPAQERAFFNKYEVGCLTFDAQIDILGIARPIDGSNIQTPAMLAYKACGFAVPHNVDTVKSVDIPVDEQSDEEDYTDDWTYDETPEDYDFVENGGLKDLFALQIDITDLSDDAFFDAVNTDEFNSVASDKHSVDFAIDLQCAADEPNGDAVDDNTDTSDGLDNTATEDSDDDPDDDDPDDDSAPTSRPTDTPSDEPSDVKGSEAPASIDTLNGNTDWFINLPHVNFYSTPIDTPSTEIAGILFSSENGSDTPSVEPTTVKGSETPASIDTPKGAATVEDWYAFSYNELTNREKILFNIAVRNPFCPIDIHVKQNSHGVLKFYVCEQTRLNTYRDRPISRKDAFQLIWQGYAHFVDYKPVRDWEGSLKLGVLVDKNGCVRIDKLTDCFSYKTYIFRRPYDRIADPVLSNGGRWLKGYLDSWGFASSMNDSILIKTPARAAYASINIDVDSTEIVDAINRAVEKFYSIVETCRRAHFSKQNNVEPPADVDTPPEETTTVKGSEPTSEAVTVDDNTPTEEPTNVKGIEPTPEAVTVDDARVFNAVEFTQRIHDEVNTLDSSDIKFLLNNSVCFLDDVKHQLIGSIVDAINDAVKTIDHAVNDIKNAFDSSTPDANSDTEPQASVADIIKVALESIDCATAEIIDQTDNIIDAGDILDESSDIISSTFDSLERFDAARDNIIDDTKSLRDIVANPLVDAPTVETSTVKGVESSPETPIETVDTDAANVDIPIIVSAADTVDTDTPSDEPTLVKGNEPTSDTPTVEPPANLEPSESDTPVEPIPEPIADLTRHSEDVSQGEAVASEGSDAAFPVDAVDEEKDIANLFDGLIDENADSDILPKGNETDSSERFSTVERGIEGEIDNETVASFDRPPEPPIVKYEFTDNPCLEIVMPEIKNSCYYEKAVAMLQDKLTALKAVIKDVLQSGKKAARILDADEEFVRLVDTLHEIAHAND